MRIELNWENRSLAVSFVVLWLLPPLVFEQRSIKGAGVSVNRKLAAIHRVRAGIWSGACLPGGIVIEGRCPLCGKDAE